MIRYRCTANKKHVWDVEKRVDTALSRLKVVPCPECGTPMERVAAKYGNECVTIDGYRFQSLGEGERYRQLIALQAQGLIRDLELQPGFDLIVTNLKTGKQVKIGKYKADFGYFDCSKGEQITEDFKGFATPTYRLKKKMIKGLYDIDIVEVYQDKSVKRKSA